MPVCSIEAQRCVGLAACSCASRCESSPSPTRPMLAQRGQGDKKAAAERMRQEVRAAIEEDKAQASAGGRIDGRGLARSCLASRP